MKSLRHWSWFLLLVPIALGLVRLRFNVEVLDLLPEDVPAVRGLKIYQQNFANARELVITVHAPDPGDADAAARLIGETLAKRTALTSAVNWQAPWLEHPGQAAEFIAYLWLNQPPEIFGQLTNRFAPAHLATTLAAAREQLTSSLSPKEIALLSYDPLGLIRLPQDQAGAAPLIGDDQDLFASSDGTFRLIFVEAREDLSSYRACIAWLEKVKSQVDSCRLSGGLGNQIIIRYTGRPAFVAEIAGGMEHDITGSVGSTILLIIALFWWAHRRWRPLLWILTLLALVLGTTLAVGGLFFGTLNVVSVGFAAILLGLAVDYGLVLYQESLCAPHLSASDVRQLLAPGIIWSAVTTAGAFLILNLGGLPGLAQLGSLVAIGVTLAAVVMLNLFLPPLTRSNAQALAPARSAPAQHNLASNAFLAWTVTVLALVVAVAILWSGFPGIDHSANSLRPRHSSAYATLEELKTRMRRPQEPYWLLAGGQNETQIARRLDAIEPILRRAATNQQIGGFTLPNALWPRPEFQSANRLVAQRLAADRESVRGAAQTSGFTGNALAFTDGLLNTWRQAGASAGVFWPTNELSRWVLKKFIAKTPTDWYALGLIYPATNSFAGVDARHARLASSSAGPSALAAELPRDQVWLAGWDMLGSALLAVVEKDFWRVLFPMTALLLVSLGLAFRRLSEVLLSLFTLAFSLLSLLALMKLAGWSWNLLNLMALPLLLGTGVDYGIHVQLALRRHAGNIAETRHHVGRALFLCAATTVAGFGSNAWSSNGGLVSLGQVCAAGIAFAYLTSTYLLPVWWKAFAGRKPPVDTPERVYPTPEPSPRDNLPSGPSHLYRAGLWQLGLVAAGKLSPRTCARFSRTLAKVYWTVARERRETVIRNLIPPLNGDRVAAEKVSGHLAENFASKLADLWRYESGGSIDGMFGELTGWEHFSDAQATGRGVLLLTPHLGNWEFGAPLLARRGVKLLVITLAEPQGRLTEIRRAARARWGIETLVIGRDPFAFVEIIRRLESGAVVALLVDRPPPASAVMVELFGRKFPASIAPAELARAAGCVLLPVYLPRAVGGYDAHILPAIPYDRPALRARESRHKLTQEIMRAFEPAIRQHLDQWYHFVPIWP